MAKQIRTPTDISQVDSDFNTFRFPGDLSFDNQGNAFYGATDPSINLSMVNIRHLNNTRMFRGTWVMTPVDGDPSDMTADEPVPYTAGQVVIGSDNLLYQLQSDGDGTVNPTDPAGSDEWTLLGQQDRLTTELTSDPESIELPLYAGNQNVSFTINEPASKSFSSTPTVVSTPALTSAPTISANGEITATIPNETDDSTIIRFTTTGSVRAAGSDDVALPTTVDSTIRFSDQRVLPTVSGEGEAPRASRLDSTQGISFNIDLTPGDSTVAAGTAYDVSWQARVGTATPGTGTTDGTYNVPNITTNSNVVFTFPLVSSPTNSQTAIPMVNNENFRITRPIQSYIPWYYVFSDTTPTNLTGATEAILVGDSQSNAFPTSGSPQVSISGNVGATTNLWLLVDTNITGSIGLGTGVARLRSERLGNTSNISVNDIAGTAITYSLHRFRIGLVSDPTIFTIFTA